MQQPPTTAISGAADELKSDAQDLGSAAANRLHSEVDTRKGEAVSQAQTVSSAIQRTADGLDESAPAWLKSAFQQGADKIQQFADSIDQKDSRQLMREAQSFARNNPGTFLAACAAAGFAAARIFKAGGDEQASQPLRHSGQSGHLDRSQPWGDGEQSGQFEQSGHGEKFEESPQPDDNPMFRSSTGARGKPLSTSENYYDPA